MRYLIDEAGHYLRAVDTTATGPLLLATAPSDSRQVWQFPGWGPVPPDAPDRKLIGVEFQGVMCSATKEDMWGLSAIAPWVQAGNSAAFEFDNGNVLVLTQENYREFTAVWGAFRASFFPVS